MSGVEALRQNMEEMEPAAESGRELNLNLSLPVNEVQTQGKIEAKRNFFFAFIENEAEALHYAESQERNFKRTKKGCQEA